MEILDIVGPVSPDVCLIFLWNFDGVEVGPRPGDVCQKILARAGQRFFTTVGP